MKLGMKIFYIFLFLINYISLVNIVGTHSIFNLIIFAFPSFILAWAIPQFFKDAIVPFFNWLAKFIPKSGD
jgi:hypothetical protein